MKCEDAVVELVMTSRYTDGGVENGEGFVIRIGSSKYHCECLTCGWTSEVFTEALIAVAALRAPHEKPAPRVN